jgi:uncharacterized protein (DUF983 family)
MRPDPAGASSMPTLSRLVGRALARHCPRCGAADIWRSWFRMRDSCPRCGLVFERGESSDFWVGAYLINLVVAETSAVMIAAIMWLALGSRVSFNVLWGASMALAIIMPLLFYPFARTLWLAFDLHFRPSEAGDTRGTTPDKS